MPNESAKSHATIDHDAIRQWAEERDGKPARVKGTGNGGTHTHGRYGGILRIDFGEPEASLEPISWDEFFKVFEENDLAFLYQKETADGKTSRFFKLVDRESVEPEEGEEEDEDDEDEKSE